MGLKTILNKLAEVRYGEEMRRGNENLCKLSFSAHKVALRITSIAFSIATRHSRIYTLSFKVKYMTKS